MACFDYILTILKVENFLIVVKFLIIRLSSIGDIVLTSPVPRVLKGQLEGAEIHFLTKKQYHQVVANNPYLDKIWLYDNTRSDLMRELKKQNFDYIVDLHNNLRTFRIKSHLRIFSFSVNKLNVAKWLMVNFKVNYLPQMHIVDRYLETLKIFDIKDDGKGLDYFTSEEDEQIPESISSILPENYIALCIGGQHFTKKMPTEKLAELCRNISLPVVILGGQEDIPEAEKINSLVRRPDMINLTGKLSLNRSAVLVRQSQTVVTHDTGLMHIAAAYGKRVISIWGNTIPEFGMYPYRPGKDSMISEVGGLTCRPCTKIGFRKCPKSHFRCMMDQDVGKIADRVNGNM